MRLRGLGLSWRRRAWARLQRLWRRYVTRRAGHDLATVVVLRPDFFGTPFTTYALAALHGPSRWSGSERELMAAVVARTAECPFCAVEHEVQARRGMERSLVDAVMEGCPHPGLDPRLRAALEFAVRLTRSPGELTVADVDELAEAGLTEADLEDVVHVTAAMTHAPRRGD